MIIVLQDREKTDLLKRFENQLSYDFSWLSLFLCLLIITVVHFEELLLYDCKLSSCCRDNKKKRPKNYRHSVNKTFLFMHFLPVPNFTSCFVLVTRYYLACKVEKISLVKIKKCIVLNILKGKRWSVSFPCSCSFLFLHFGSFLKTMISLHIFSQDPLHTGVAIPKVEMC